MPTQNAGLYSDAAAIDINPAKKASPDDEGALVQAEKLEEIGAMLAELRWQAVNGRYQSGIEQLWIEDQEFYEGIDDANRHEHASYRSKPPHQQETLGDERTNERKSTSSTVFPNVTAPYVDAMSARVADVLLPTDGASFSIAPTPLPEMIEIEEALPDDDDMARVEEGLGNMPEGPERDAARRSGQAELVRQALPEDVRGMVEQEAAAQYGEDAMATPEAQAAVESSYLDLAKQIKADMKAARKAASNAQKQIEDWHVECQFTSQVRKCLEMASRIGTGVLKGPYPYMSRKVAYKGGKLIVKDEVKPGSASVDPWNCFPDPGCGEDIQNGNSHFERDHLSKRSLAKLASEPDYLPEQVGRVLQEGPMWCQAHMGPTEEMSQAMGMIRRDMTEQYEVWYCYAFLDRQDAELCGLDCDDMPDYELIPIEATMVNSTIIKVILNPLDTGDFPYDYVKLKSRVGSPFGAGVARQLRVAQRIFTAACRNLMDNAGLSGGAMWTYLDGVIEPVDGQYGIAPRKGWKVNVDMLKDPRMIEWAFRFIEMPSRTEELLSIMNMALKMAEDTTGLPALMQGQQGNAPDTVGGMNILNQNASTVLRRVAKLFDDQVNEPHIKRYYQYLLQYGEDDGMKGDFAVDAKGSAALVERALQDETIAQMGPLVENPVFGKDPKKWFDLFMKSKRLDGHDLDYEDEEWQQIVEGLAAQAQQADPRVEIAQMTNQTRLQVAQMAAQGKQGELQLKGEMFEADKAFQMAREAREEERSAMNDQMQREFDAMFADLNAQIEAAKIDSKERQVLETMKAHLAETSMKLQAQFDMQESGGGEVVTPPVEPAGRAPEGQAYQR